MKVFLTGVSGFVGRNLARALIDSGHSVIAAVRTTSDRSRIPVGCDVRVADIEDWRSVAEHLDGVDAIQHVAGAVKARTQEDFDRANAGSTAAIAKAAGEVCPDALLVLTSSQAACGPCGTGPVTAYGRSKVLAEQAATGMGRYIVVRPPAVFGPGDSATENLFKWASRGITVSTGGEPGGFPVIGVSDLAVFMTLVMTSPGASGKVLQPSWPELITWKRFHAALEEAFQRRILRLRVPSFMVHTAGFFSEVLSTFTGACPMVTRDKARELTAPSWVLLQHEVEELTGWKPTQSLEDIFSEIAVAARG
jgi:nucleoside-diphosphate-sugar epimerase